MAVALVEDPVATVAAVTETKVEVGPVAGAAAQITAGSFQGKKFLVRPRPSAML
jgi:hypothetical protein